jgi:hypothetical protein
MTNSRKILGVIIARPHFLLIPYSTYYFKSAEPNNQRNSSHDRKYCFFHLDSRMDSTQLPEAIAFAVRTGKVAQLGKVFTPSEVSVQDIAIEAANHDQPAILEWCYAQGWKPSLDTEFDPFYSAAMFSASPKIFQVMLDHGWDINHFQSMNCGDTLGWTIAGGQYDFAKWLLEHGHNPTPSDPLHGPSSIAVTIRGDSASTSMLRALIDHGYNLQESGAAIAAAEDGNIEALKIVLDAGVDLEDRNMLGWYRFDDDEDEPYDSEGTAKYVFPFHSTSAANQIIRCQARRLFLSLPSCLWNYS